MSRGKGTSRWTTWSLSFVWTTAVSSALAQAATLPDPSAAATTEPPEAQSAVSDCAAQHEQAQEQRLSGQLRSALAHLAACSRPECPEVIRNDCVRWSPELRASIPSLVVSVRRGNEDVGGGRLSIDGEALTEPFDGREIELDPGSHELVVELDGEAPLRRTVVVSKGERARHVLFELTPPEAPKPTVEAAREPKPLPSSARPIGTWTYAFGGVAVAGYATAAILGGLGLSQRNALQADCAPFCSDEQTSGTHALLVGADVALAIGLASTAAAVVSYLLRPETLIQPIAGPLNQGAYLGATGSF